MELKFLPLAIEGAGTKGSNRTFMELKLSADIRDWAEPELF